MTSFFSIEKKGDKGNRKALKPNHSRNLVKKLSKEKVSACLYMTNLGRDRGSKPFKGEMSKY